MTPEERVAAHQQWLLDHDRAMAKHGEMMAKHAEDIAEIRAIQRQQSAVLLEIAQYVARRLDRHSGGGADAP